MAPSMAPPTLRLLVYTHEWRAAFQWQAGLQLKPSWNTIQAHLTTCDSPPSFLRMATIEVYT